MTVSVDVEDWHQLVTRRFRDGAAECSAHLEAQTHGLLDRFEAASVKGTFFVLGMVARAKPALVRTIAARGHEIASHGISHTPLFRLSPAALASELADSRKMLEDISGADVVGFRAPEFSIRRDNLDALEAVAIAGYRYDSSIFPIVNRRYGIAGFHRAPCRLTTPGGRTLFELPLATASIGNARLPVAGGGYFRLLPGSVLRAMFRRNASRGEYSMLYFHPYEFANSELVLPEEGLPTEKKYRAKARAWLKIQALGRRRVGARFDDVVRGASFVRARDLVSALDACAAAA